METHWEAVVVMLERDACGLEQGGGCGGGEKWSDFSVFRRLIWISNGFGTFIGLDFRDHLDLFWGQVGNTNAWNELHDNKAFEKQDAVPYHIKKLKHHVSQMKYTCTIGLWTSKLHPLIVKSFILQMRDQGPRKIVDFVQCH